MCKWARRRQREDARISKSLITRWLKGLAETRERDDTNHLPMIGSALLSYFNHFQHPNDMSDRLIFFPRRLHHRVLQHDIQIDEASQGYWSFASLCSSLSSSFSQITSFFLLVWSTGALSCQSKGWSCLEGNIHIYYSLTYITRRTALVIVLAHGCE